eukprot:757339-Hanusia_phi.AAC.5
MAGSTSPRSLAFYSPLNTNHAVSSCFNPWRFLIFACSYLVEFYFLLKELRAYQQEKGQLGKMPPFKQLTADGRRDLMRMICKHGGQMDVRRKPYLYWGPFSIDFAIDLIEIAGVSASPVLLLPVMFVCQRHCEEVGQGERILMPNATTLQAINRTDMIEKASFLLDTGIVVTWVAD